MNVLNLSTVQPEVSLDGNGSSFGSASIPAVRDPTNPSLYRPPPLQPARSVYLSTLIASIVSTYPFGPRISDGRDDRQFERLLGFRHCSTVVIVPAWANIAPRSNFSRARGGRSSACKWNHFSSLLEDRGFSLSANDSGFGVIEFADK